MRLMSLGLHGEERVGGGVDALLALENTLASNGD